MEKPLSLNQKDSRFTLKLLLIAGIATVPFFEKVFTGHAAAFWSFPRLEPFFFGALALYVIGIALAFVCKNRTVGITLAAILTVPFFALPFFDVVIITAISGY